LKKLDIYVNNLENVTTMAVLNFGTVILPRYYRKYNDGWPKLNFY